MHRNDILEKLRRHRGFDIYEEAMVEKTIEFIEANPDCFERTLTIGHVTASAWVIDLKTQKALLTHHSKLDAWFQLGGHCDGNSDVLAAAKREVIEESGLEEIMVYSPFVFDVDVHQIPENKREAAHWHYDIRFLLEADSSKPLVVSSESKDLQWISFDDVKNYNDSSSIIRMVKKMEFVVD